MATTRSLGRTKKAAPSPKASTKSCVRCRVRTGHSPRALRVTRPITQLSLLVQKAVGSIQTGQQITSGGQLGKPSSARRRVYDRLKDYAAQVKDSLFWTSNRSTRPLTKFTKPRSPSPPATSLTGNSALASAMKNFLNWSSRSMRKTGFASRKTMPKPANPKSFAPLAFVRIDSYAIEHFQNPRSASNPSDFSPLFIEELGIREPPASRRVENGKAKEVAYSRKPMSLCLAGIGVF